uniref:Uncharacterized protein n=1 Tax=Anguilla anguilla TaxID=7936 RepID=A0A0E9PVM2_ANGAN
MGSEEQCELLCSELPVTCSDYFLLCWTKSLNNNLTVITLMLALIIWLNK